MWSLALSAAIVLTASPELAGYWEGKVTRGAAESAFEVEFSETDGGLTGRVSFPESGTRDNRLDTVEVTGETVTFGYQSGRNDRTFTGTVDGATLSGTLAIEEHAEDEYTFEVTRIEHERPYAEEDLTYTNGDVSIAATLFIPDGDGPHPAVVMLHGSGDNERDRYRFWADWFARRGVACLIADKRGSGESTGDWMKVGFEALAMDGIRGVELLQQRDDIDAERVGLTGISQAGWIMTLAATLSEDVAFLLVDSSSTTTVEEEGYYDYMIQLGDAGYDEDVKAKALKLLKMDNAVTRTGEGFEDMRAYWSEVKDEEWFKLMRFVPLGVKNRFRDFYRLIIDHDPLPILQELDVPAIWFWGAEDKSVDTARCSKIVREIKDEMDKDWTIHVYPDADHGLRVPPGDDDALPFWVYPDAYLADKEQWLKERVLKDEL